MTSFNSSPRLGRRDMLRIGSLTVLGLTLGDRIRLQAADRPKVKSCILLWLDGGPSHLETFDLKPDAPEEVRGPFQPIKTKVPGLELCELLPNTAKIADKIAVVRSLTSPLGEHGLANHYLLTGYKPSPVLQYPSLGSVLSEVRGGQHTLPPYAAVPDASAYMGAGFLGSSRQPFAVGGDPSKPDFRVRDLDFYPGVNTSRVDRRREFVSQLDRFQERSANADPAFEQAYRLITTPEAKQAFDLSKEKAETRGAYGPRTLGQSCLLARRLVERGVGFVTVNNPGWDTHGDLVLRLKEGYAGAKIGVGLIPTFDLAFSALVSDLSDRGLLDETLVIAMGEFGRTPKVNTGRGRDHWPRAFSAVFAGGGVRGGQVIGASDRTGESPADNPITPTDLAATIFTLLGVKLSHELHTGDGRPVAVNQGGKIIRELCA
jgi:hypothetical protein